MPILEAQTVGRPVITSSIYSMPEVAGNAAVFVNPFDVSGIRAGLISILTDDVLRTELIRKGFENVRRFAGDRIARQYYELYVSVLNQNN